MNRFIPTSALFLFALLINSCGPEATIQDRNKEIIRYWIEQLDTRNISVYDELLAEGAMVHFPGGVTLDREQAIESEEAWYAAHPPGWVEYAESMGPDGVYGAWLRSLPVAVEINNVLFVHGGVHQEIEDREVASINRRVVDEIKSFDGHEAFMVAEGLCLPTSSAGEMVNVINQEALFLNNLEDSERTSSNPRVARLLQIYDLSQWKSWSVLDGKGPLCFRGAARWPEDEHGHEMAAILEAFDVERMVTGQSDGRNRMIQARFDNRVLLTSIDMTDDPDGRGGDPAALEIVDGDYFVVTMGGRDKLIDN